MNKLILKLLIKSNLPNLKKKKKRKLKPLIYPTKLEKEFVKKIKDIFVDKILGYYLNFTEQDFENWKKLRKDALNFEDYIYGLITTEIDIEKTFGEILEDTAIKISTYTDEKLTEVFGDFISYTGIKLTGLGQEQLEKAIKRWYELNGMYFKSLNEDIKKKLLTNLEESLKQGWSWMELKEELIKIYDFTENRAELIARDQIGKFYLENIKIKQTDLGLDIYQWFALGDERMCEICGQLNGKYFKWSDNKIWSIDAKRWEERPDEFKYLTPANAHPQCRCTAVAYLEDLIEEVEMEEEQVEF